MSEFEALMAEIDVTPIAGTACARPRNRNADTGCAKLGKYKTAGVVAAEAEAAIGAPRAGHSEIEALLHLGVGRSGQQQQQQGKPWVQVGQRQSQPQQDFVSSLASGGKGASETVVRVVDMAGRDTAQALAEDVTGDDLKEMAAAAFRQLDVLEASLAATQALVGPLEAQLRATFEVKSRLEAGTLKAAQRKEQAQKDLKALVCRRRTRSLRAGFNAVRNFGAEAAEAQPEECLARRDDGVEGAPRVALDAESKDEDRVIETTTRQAAVTATFRFMAMKALVRREQASSLRPAFDAMRKFSLEKNDTPPVPRTIGARQNEDAGQQQSSAEPNTTSTWGLYDMAMSFIDTPQLFTALFEFDASFLAACSLPGETFRILTCGGAKGDIRTSVRSETGGKHHTGYNELIEQIAASIITAVGEYLCDELRDRVFARLRGIVHESVVPLAATGARPCTRITLCAADVGPVSLDAPSATANVTPDGNEKDKRPTLSKYLDVLGEGNGTEPGRQEDGAAAFTPGVAMEPMGLNSARPADDTSNTRASESVITETTATKPDASQVERSEGAEGIRKRSQVSSLLGVMDKVMEEWCSQQISDTLGYLKACPSSGFVLSPEETAEVIGQNGNSEVLPDGAEGGTCWKEEDDFRREHRRECELREIATIFGRLDLNDRRNFMIWFNFVRKAVNAGAEALERRKAAEANMKVTGGDAKADSKDTRRKKLARKAKRKNQGKEREATKEETNGGKTDNAPGFCFSSPEGGSAHQRKLPLTFAPGVSMGAGTNTAFVFGRDNTTKIAWTSSSSPQRRLQNREKKHGGQPRKTASTVLRATFDAEESHPTSLIYAAHPIIRPQTNVNLCDGDEEKDGSESGEGDKLPCDGNEGEDGSKLEEGDQLPCDGNEGEDGSEPEEEGSGDGACSMTSVFSIYQY